MEQQVQERVRVISGTALYGDDSQYTVTQKYDSRLDRFVNYYYYWVKGNTTCLPTVW